VFEGDLRGAGERGGDPEDGAFDVGLDQGCEADGWNCGVELADPGAVVFEFAGLLRERDGPNMKSGKVSRCGWDGRKSNEVIEHFDARAMGMMCSRSGVGWSGLVLFLRRCFDTLAAYVHKGRCADCWGGEMRSGFAKIPGRS